MSKTFSKSIRAVVSASNISRSQQHADEHEVDQPNFSRSRTTQQGAAHA